MSATGGRGRRAARDGVEPGKRRRRALDLDHLRRQCLGDEGLAGELLSLFRDEARAAATRLACGERLSSSASADIAHRLRGSALAVGALAVARAAESVEACGGGGAAAGGVRVVEMSQAIARLGDAVVRATAEIDRLTPQKHSISDDWTLF